MIKADIYFEQNFSSAKRAYESAVVEAYKVKAGERAITYVGFNIQTTAEEDGWQVIWGDKYLLLTNKEFEEGFKPCEKIGQKPLPEGTDIKPVKKGQTVMTQPFSDTDLGVQVTADTDGFLVTLPEDNKTQFFSYSKFTATFNANVEKPQNTDEQGLFREIISDDAKAVKYITLTQDITFDFKSGAYAAKAGDVLVENSQDEDGFTLFSPQGFEKSYVTKNNKPTPKQTNTLKR